MIKVRADPTNSAEIILDPEMRLPEFNKSTTIKIFLFVGSTRSALRSAFWMLSSDCGVVGPKWEVSKIFEAGPHGSSPVGTA